MRISRTYLFLTASIAALSACSDVRQSIYEKYTGERVGAGVNGPRRSPELNPSFAGKSPAASAVAMPVQAAAPKSPTPYDQFDAEGNESGGTNYIAQWMGSKPDTAAERTAEDRKPFRGLSASAEAPPSAPVAIQSLQKRATPAAPATSAISPPLPVDSGDNQVMVPLPQQRSENKEVPAVQIAQLQPAAGGPPPANDKDLHLSSVPKPPERFGEVKKEKAAAQKELQDEHDSAMEEKKKLDEEPSDQKPVTLPQVNGMLDEIHNAIKGDTPIVQAAR